MNFIDRIRIKRRPNIIDTWKITKINEEVIEFAIRNGYQFKPEHIGKFFNSPIYAKAFKTNPQFIQFAREQAMSIGDLNDGFSMYNKNELVEILKKDKELAKLALHPYRKMLELEDADIIKIIAGNEELIKIAAQNLLSKEICEYIASMKSPNELAELGLFEYQIDDVWKEAFLNTGDPNKIIELLEKEAPNSEKEIYIQSLKQQISNEPEKYYLYLDKLNQLCNNNLIDEEIKQKTVEFLINNKIAYSDNLPKFALENKEYALHCLAQNPKLFLDEKFKETFQFKIDLKEHPKIANEIALNIIENNIQFPSIPYQYQECKQIFEAIVCITPELLQKAENRNGLWLITKEMTIEERIQYYREIGVPFNSETVLEEDFNMVLECLKNDFMTLSDTRKLFTKEQYEEIYRTLKGTISNEQVLASHFLKHNPYFAMDLLQDGIDPEELDLEKVKYYDELFLEFKALAIRNDITIPPPNNRSENQHGINFFRNQVTADLKSIEGIKRGIEWINANGLDQEIEIKTNLQDLESIINGIEFVNESGLSNRVIINIEQRRGK